MVLYSTELDRTLPFDLDVLAYVMHGIINVFSRVRWCCAESVRMYGGEIKATTGSSSHAVHTLSVTDHAVVTITPLSTCACAAAIWINPAQRFLLREL